MLKHVARFARTARGSAPSRKNKEELGNFRGGTGETRGELAESLGGRGGGKGRGRGGARRAEEAAEGAAADEDGGVEAAGHGQRDGDGREQELDAEEREQAEAHLRHRLAPVAPAVVHAVRVHQRLVAQPGPQGGAGGSRAGRGGSERVARPLGHPLDPARSRQPARQQLGSPTLGARKCIAVLQWQTLPRR